MKEYFKAIDEGTTEEYHNKRRRNRMRSKRCKYPDRLDECCWRMELINDNPKKKRVYCEAPSWNECVKLPREGKQGKDICKLNEKECTGCGKCKSKGSLGFDVIVTCDYIITREKHAELVMLRTN